MKKVELNESPIEKIPSSVIGDILSRLPTKSCMNCKLVCKEWHNVIIDPEFSALRSSRCLYHPLMLHCSSNDGKHYYMLIDLDKPPKYILVGYLKIDDDSVMKFKLNIPYYKLSIINECNGLICLNSLEKKWSPYIICNLLTGEKVVVTQVYDRTCASVEHYGLGCCPVSKQLKVLKVLQMRNGKNVANIQTLGSNEWRDIGDAPLMNNSRKSVNAVSLHGSLHCYSEVDDAIWSFHFGNEHFVQVPKSDHMNNTGRKGRVTVFESCLCFCFFTGDARFGEMWVMKEYGMKDSWAKQFCFQFPSMTIHRPLFRTGDGQILVSNGHNITSFNTNSKRCTIVYLPGVLLIEEAMVFDANFAKFN